MGNIPLTSSEGFGPPLWGFANIYKKMETAKKSTHGGARVGAGRKSKGAERRKTLAVRVKPETLASVEALAKSTGKSKGQLIDEAISKLLN